MTIIRWCDSGVLHATTTPGGHRRITEASVRDYLTKRGLAIPPELTPQAVTGAARVVVLCDTRSRRALAPALRGLSAKLHADPLETVVDVCCDPPAMLLLEASGSIEAAEIVRALRSHGRTSSLPIVVWGSPAAVDAAREAGATHAFRNDALDDVERVLSTLRAAEGGRRGRSLS